MGRGAGNCMTEALCMKGRHCGTGQSGTGSGGGQGGGYGAGGNEPRQEGTAAGEQRDSGVEYQRMLKPSLSCGTSLPRGASAFVSPCAMHVSLFR